MSKILSKIGKKKNNCWKEKEVEKTKTGSALNLSPPSSPMVRPCTWSQDAE